MKRLFVFAIMVMSLASLSAKEKIEKVKVRGEYTLLTTADVTFKQAAAEALKDAKRKAIESTEPPKPLPPRAEKYYFQC